jgi:hypothetical protein
LLRKTGFEDAIIAALAAEKVLAADQTPVNVLDKAAPLAAESAEKDPEEKKGSIRAWQTEFRGGGNHPSEAGWWPAAAGTGIPIAFYA